MFPSGLAAQEGTIERGDEVLSINGQTLKNVTHSDATAILRQARTMKQAVIVVSKNKDPEGKGGANANESSCSSGAESSVTGGPTLLTSAQPWHSCVMSTFNRAQKEYKTLQLKSNKKPSLNWTSFFCEVENSCFTDGLIPSKSDTSVALAQLW